MPGIGRQAPEHQRSERHVRAQGVWVMAAAAARRSFPGWQLGVYSYALGSGASTYVVSRTHLPSWRGCARCTGRGWVCFCVLAASRFLIGQSHLAAHKHPNPRAWCVYLEARLSRCRTSCGLGGSSSRHKTMDEVQCTFAPVPGTWIADSANSSSASEAGSNST